MLKLFNKYLNQISSLHLYPRNAPLYRPRVELRFRVPGPLFSNVTQNAHNVIARFRNL